MKNRSLLFVGVVLALSTAAFALAPRTFEDFGLQTTFHAKKSTAGNIAAVNGIPIKITMVAQGGSADFTVASSTDNTMPYVFVSSTIYLLPGSSNAYVSEFRGIVYGSSITVSRIDSPGTTVYATIEYLYPRTPSAY